MKRSHALIGLAVSGIILAGCGSSGGYGGGDSNTTAAPSTTAAATSDTTAAATGGAAATGDATVAVADVPEVGQALVNADGLTLYLFEQDDGTTTACTGACANVWPAAVADGDPVGGDGVDASLLSTADGSEPNQVVYNGHLLYAFSGDSAPGDANGIGIPDWYPVDPAGDAIDSD